MTKNKEKIVAIIPIRGSDEEFKNGNSPLLGDKPLLEYTFDSAKESRLLDRVIVSTDDEGVAKLCRSMGIEVPFIRPTSLSGPKSTLTDVLLHAIHWLEEKEKVSSDWVVKMEITHPFRPAGIIDRLIETALKSGVDSAFLAYEEQSRFWTMNAESKPQLISQAMDMPRKTRTPFYRELSGLGTITKTSNLKSGNLYGPNLGLIPFHDIFSIVDTHEGNEKSYREKAGFRLAEYLAPSYKKEELVSR